MPELSRPHPTRRPAGETAPSPPPVPPPAPHNDAALDLSSCDREPIHIPGSIQPHGFLLALDPASLRVREVSANAAGFLGCPLSALFDRSLPELFGARCGSRLAAEIRSADLATSPRLLSSVDLPRTGDVSPSFEVVAHQTSASAGGQTEGQTSAGAPGSHRIVLECEQIREPVDLEAINSRLYNFVAANRGERSIQAALEAAVRELRSITGCDRVVLYRFDEQGHGLVLAEERDEQFASYLGLRFPASDVPQQARRLYQINRVRIIPDVDYTPSPLVAPSGAPPRASPGTAPAPELDLSSSMLRSVSPVHRAYMRNMGTRCSMSVSILVDGKLWGLVSCHHHQARYVPLRLRAACDFVMQVVGAQIDSQQSRSRLERVLQARAIQGNLLGAMARHSNYMDGLLASAPLLMEMVKAHGLSIVVGNTIHVFGAAPTQGQILPLAEWLRKLPGKELFHSSCLSDEYPPAAEFTSDGSGLIAASLSKIYSTWVLWFRRELVSTVRWAGDPQKPAEPGGEGLAPGSPTVHPRHSFEEWLQIVRAQSAPWTAEELAAASEFRSAVLEIVLKRAEELADMAAGLKVANEELEAFSYSVSHDLRAPFRHISGFSEMLREEEAEHMSPRGRHYLETIMESARFAGTLVDNLLDFSRIARTPIELRPVDMEQLVDGQWQAVLYDQGQGRAIEFERGPLPRVLGDAPLLRQVVRNLLSNAVKYTGRQEVARIHFSAEPQGHEFLFAVRDNGVGFDQQYAGKLFGVFQRLHRAEDFEGTGIGLANVRRIVNRHGGRTWAEGEPGIGATFFFSMPATFPEEGQ